MNLLAAIRLSLHVGIYALRLSTDSQMFGGDAELVQRKFSIMCGKLNVQSCVAFSFLAFLFRCCLGTDAVCLVQVQIPLLAEVDFYSKYLMFMIKGDSTHCKFGLIHVVWCTTLSL